MPCVRLRCRGPMDERCFALARVVPGNVTWIYLVAFAVGTIGFAVKHIIGGNVVRLLLR